MPSKLFICAFVIQPLHTPEVCGDGLFISVYWYEQTYKEYPSNSLFLSGFIVLTRTVTLSAEEKMLPKRHNIGEKSIRNCLHVSLAQ